MRIRRKDALGQRSRHVSDISSSKSSNQRSAVRVQPDSGSQKSGEAPLELAIEVDDPFARYDPRCQTRTLVPLGDEKCQAVDYFLAEAAEPGWPMGHFGPAIDHFGAYPLATRSFPSGCSAKNFFMYPGGVTRLPSLCVITETDSGI
jgi:hypothetical protein